jgi:hypothetical protein
MVPVGAGSGGELGSLEGPFETEDVQAVAKRSARQMDPRRMRARSTSSR